MNRISFSLRTGFRCCQAIEHTHASIVFPCPDKPTDIFQMLPAYLYVFASMFCSSQARQDFRQYLGSEGKASSLNLRLSPPIPEAMAAPAVPASWSKRGQGVKCNLCQAEKAAEDMQESGRCRECGPLRSRVLRLFTANNTHRDEFLSLTQDAKKKFYEENRDKFGQDLKIAIASIVKQSTEHVQCASLVGNGTFLDEADMRDKYKAKPGRADAIIANTRNFVCPIAKVTLYEDMQYLSKREETTKRCHTEESIMSQEATIKPPKKPRTIKAVQENPTGEPEPKPLSESQMATLAKYNDAYARLDEALTSKIDMVQKEDLSKFIPSHTIPSVTTFREKIRAEKAELEIAIESKHGTLKDVWARQNVFSDISRIVLIV